MQNIFLERKPGVTPLRGVATARKLQVPQTGLDKLTLLPLANRPTPANGIDASPNLFQNLGSPADGVSPGLGPFTKPTNPIPFPNPLFPSNPNPANGIDSSPNLFQKLASPADGVSGAPGPFAAKPINQVAIPNPLFPVPGTVANSPPLNVPLFAKRPTGVKPIVVKKFDLNALKAPLVGFPVPIPSLP